MTPKVSVILPSYNHEQYVEAAVRSVMGQTGVDFELIVIDDGSKDRSFRRTRLQVYPSPEQRRCRYAKRIARAHSRALRLLVLVG